jgi:hypothetical protein
MISGQLEIDHDRGVIYFHANNPSLAGAVTMLRICQLPTPIPKRKALDITHMHGADWEGKPGFLTKSVLVADSPPQGQYPGNGPEPMTPKEIDRLALKVPKKRQPRQPKAGKGSHDSVNIDP